MSVPRKKRLSGFSSTVKSSLNAAVTEVWDDVLADIKKQSYATISGFGRCEIVFVEGSSGTEWVRAPLSKLVDNYIQENEKNEPGEEVGWVVSAAADLEKQARRLRKLAARLNAG